MSVKLMRDTKKEMVTNWNNNYRIGQSVTIKKDNGEILLTKTSSLATLLGGHTPAIWLEDVSGCYALDRVTAV